VLVADVTACKAALQPNTPPRTEVESTLAKLRREKQFSFKLEIELKPCQPLADYALRLMS